MKRKIILTFGIAISMLSSSIVFAQKESAEKIAANPKSLNVVNKYLDIVLVANKNGEGLSEILTDDFIFNDPFAKTSGSKEFIHYA